MQVIILLAGQGNRMKPLTDTKHKSLLAINKTDSFLSKLLNQINEYEIDKVVVVTGYRSADIEKCLSHYQFNYQVVFNNKYQQDVNIYSMQLALNNLEKNTTIIIEGDIYLDDLAFRKIYFKSLANRSIWFTKGDFKKPQYGGILASDNNSNVIDLKIVKQYKDCYKYYKKLLGITTIGTDEFDKFKKLVSEYASSTIKQYYLTPWINNLTKLPSKSLDLDDFFVESVNTVSEYHLLKQKINQESSKVINWELTNVNKLKPIEGCIKERVEYLFQKITKDKVWIKPIIIDDKFGLVLDGHHRFEVAKLMKLAKIPAVAVSYQDIKIWSLKASYNVSHKIVIQKALSGDIYPNKTVKHRFLFTVPDCLIDLERLV